MSIDILWIVVGLLFILAGIVGCVLPIIPGPPLSFVGLLILQLTEEAPFSTTFLLIWAGVAIVVTVLDYVIPAYGTKKFGGSKRGVWGSMIGLVIGLFFAPFGIIIGPLLGALVGELTSGAETKQAMKAAFGSFIGFLAGTLLKLLASSIMAFYFFQGAFF
ncbi:MAG: DUF456 domain-containing protein [Bacteroidota bacterium]